MIKMQHQRLTSTISTVALMGCLAIAVPHPALADRLTSISFVDAMARLERQATKATVIQLKNAWQADQMQPPPAIGDKLGWILVQKRDTEEGLRDSQDIGDHLAYAQNSWGDKTTANKLLEDLENRPQPFMEKEKALELLEALKNS